MGDTLQPNVPAPRLPAGAGVTSHGAVDVPVVCWQTVSRSAVLDTALVTAIGMGDQLLTLTGPIINEYHPTVGEAMFAIRSEELSETAYLERRYVLENGVSIKAAIGKGDKVLVWAQRVMRPANSNPTGPLFELLVAREFFLLADWREFGRFRQFLKSMRILDAQSRAWLSEHHKEFGELARVEAGIIRILQCLAHVAEWPDLDDNSSDNGETLERIAKTYSADLAKVRTSPLLPPRLMALEPTARFNLFRMLSYVEDPQGGAAAMLKFLAVMAAATGDGDLATTATRITSGQELSKVLTGLRRWLLSPRRPPAAAPTPL